VTRPGIFRAGIAETRDQANARVQLLLRFFFLRRWSGPSLFLRASRR
jgi:hypothetical protein